MLKTVTRLAGYRYDTIHPTDHSLDYAATVFTILEIFGLGNKVKALYGGEVNSLHNVIIMVINLHSVFHSFNLWLEPVLGWVCCVVYSVILHSSYMVYSGKHLWCLRETTWLVPSAHPIMCHIQHRTPCWASRSNPQRFGRYYSAGWWWEYGWTSFFMPVNINTPIWG